MKSIKTIANNYSANHLLLEFYFEFELCRVSAATCHQLMESWRLDFVNKLCKRFAENLISSPSVVAVCCFGAKCHRSNFVPPLNCITISRVSRRAWDEGTRVCVCVCLCARVSVCARGVIAHTVNPIW